ncbi:MAG: HlyD family efflux transporter periplasmic adaptor subunit [Hyphomicrobiales bacterium]
MSDVSVPNYAMPHRQSKTSAKLLPELRVDLVLKLAPRDNDGSPNWILHDPIAGKYLKLGWVEHEILSRWKFRDAGQIAARVSRETSITTNAEDVDQFASLLLRYGMLRADWRVLANLKDAKQEIIGKNSSAIMTSKVLFPKFPLVRPQRFLDATYPFVAPFFSKGFAVLTGLVLLIALFLVSRQWTEFVSTFSFLFSFEGLVVTIFALALSKILHELAHAYSSKKYGVRVPSMGVALLVFFPVLFTETSDAWMIPERRARIGIAAAGMLAEMAFAVFALLAWSLLDDGPLRSACFVLASTVWVMSLLVNLNPLVRFDGYFILSEALGVENMSTRAAALGRFSLLKLWTGHNNPNTEPYTSNRGKFWLYVYFIAMLFYRLFLYLAIGGTLFYLFPKVVSIPSILIILSVFISRPMFNLASDAAHLAKEQGKLSFWIRSGILILVMLCILFIPFRSTYTAPSIISPGETLDLFAPEASQIISLDVQIGDLVSKNQVLAELKSPDLVSLVKRTTLRAQSLELFLQRQITNESYRESQEVQLKQLLQVQAERKGYLDRIQALKLRAGIDGTVTNVIVDARTGRWINNSSALVTVVSNEGYRVEAYFDETEIGKLPIGTDGILMIDGSPELEFKVVLKDIAPTGQDVLVNTLLASVHDGPIAVRQSEGGQLIPERGIYRARFIVEGNNPFEVLPNRELRGAIKMKADALSLASKIYGKFTSILLRETGVQLPELSIR